MLEAASELVGSTGWERRQTRIDLRPQGPFTWDVRLLASDGPDAVAEVLDGSATFAILNPATALLPALRRLTDDLDALATIATIPSYDQMGFAVAARLGVATLDEIAARRLPLRLSLRSQRNHAVQLVVEDVLAAAGLSLELIESWGGSVSYDDGIPHRGERARILAEGAVDGVFDEGIYNWTDPAVDAGYVFVGPGPDALARLEAQGYRATRLRRDRYPALERDVPTVDFSGFLVYTRRDTDDAVVDAFCTALHTRRDRIPWQGGPSLPLERMLGDAVDAPVPVAMHPAALAAWRRLGYAA